MKDGETLGELAGRLAAIVTFLDGMWIRRPQVMHCGAVGKALAELHLAGAGFALTRVNALSVPGWRPLYERAKDRADTVAPNLAATIAAELAHCEASWPQDLPTGVIHADLFNDNVFFLNDRLSGLIDFYFACNDILAYDLAICLNAWCFSPDGEFDFAKGRAMIAAYQRSGRSAPGRPRHCRCSPAARPCFLLTRLVDWLNVPPGAVVTPKDPLEYLRKLRFHQKVASPTEVRPRMTTSADPRRVEIFTDGACSGNPGPAAGALSCAMARR